MPQYLIEMDADLMTVFKNSGMFKLVESRSDTPFSHKEFDTITEVFASYEMTPAQEKTAWASITRRWHDTSGRFYAYTVAHEIAAKVTHK